MEWPKPTDTHAITVLKNGFHKYLVVVEVIAPNKEAASQIMTERLGYDEIYDLDEGNPMYGEFEDNTFDYFINPNIQISESSSDNITMGEL